MTSETNFDTSGVPRFHITYEKLDNVKRKINAAKTDLNLKGIKSDFQKKIEEDEEKKGDNYKESQQETNENSDKKNSNLNSEELEQKGFVSYNEKGKIIGKPKQDLPQNIEHFRGSF